MEKINAIIFDVDGVVFKAYDVDGAYLWSKNIKKEHHMTKDHFKKIFTDKWNDITKGRFSMADHLNEVFKDPIFSDVTLTPEEYIKYWLEKDNNVDSNVLEFVKSLEIPCYLGTNQEELRTKHILEYTKGYFKGCFASYEIGYIKPESGFFEHIEKKLNISSGNLLLIDDKEEYVAGTEKRGWRAFHYKDNLEDLKSFIKSFSGSFVKK